MALPIGVTQLGTFKGDKGDPGTFSGATATSVPADQPAEVNIIGPASAPVAAFKIPRGLPGTNATENDTAFSTYIGAVDTQTRAALNGWLAARTGVTINLADYPTLYDACQALPANGGTIFVPKGRFYAGPFNATAPMSKPNVTIIGAKLPQIAADCSSLYDGSVIEGSFLVHAENFFLHNVGFDMGKQVVQARWPSLNPHTDPHPTNGATWEPFGFKLPAGAGVEAAKRNVFLGDIISLNYDPQTLGHAMLIEGIQSGRFGNLVGIGSAHGIALKVQNVDIGSLVGISASANAVTIKSDSYALCGNLRVRSAAAHRIGPGMNPWWGTSEPMGSGMILNPETAHFSGRVEVGSLHVFGAASGLAVSASDNTYAMVGAHFDSIFVDGGGSASAIGVNGAVAWADRVSVDALTAQNLGIGVKWSVGSSSPLSIGRASIVNASTRVMEAGGSSVVDFGVIEGVNSPKGYSIWDNARVFVDREQFTSVASRFENNFGPRLGNGWAAASGSEARIVLDDGGVRLGGTVQSDGTSATIVYIPTANFAPRGYVRVPAMVKRPSAAWGVEMLNVANDKVQIKDGEMLPNGTQVSLDGVFWELKAQ